MPRLKKQVSLRESFPDRELTQDELKRLYNAVKKAGRRDKYLAKLGFVRLNKHGLIMAVKEFEDLRGVEVLKGSGITYFSNIPFQWWNDVGFVQLDRYERTIAIAVARQALSLDDVAKTIAKEKRL
jgi:hypothetical protein